MKCRRYDKKIVINKVNSDATADAHGQIDQTDDSNWIQHVESFAAVVSKGGREFWKVDQVQADVTHVWYCPYSETLNAATPDMRLVSESLTYEIVSVMDIDLAHHEIEIRTKRAV